MKSITVLASLFCILTMAYSQQVNTDPLTKEFDKLLSEQYKSNKTGATALISRNGQIIYKKAFGLANLEYNIPMQVDNVFRIGSITKQMTAVAILQLMEQGKVSLQDDITKFFPDYPTHGYKITVEQLLTHTSGIKSYTEMEDFDKKMSIEMKPLELIQYFKNQPMDFAPGTKWSYNNSAYFILGYIIEKISGKTYPQYIEEQFFKPLGMSNSLYGSDTKIILNRAGGYDEDSTGIINAPYLSMSLPYAAGSVQSTVEDLFKWHQAVHSYKLIKKETLEKAFTKFKLQDGKETNYGYGWFLETLQENPTIEHTGGINGFLTQSIYLPKQDVFVAVFSNCTCNPPATIGAKLAALAIGKPYGYTEIKLPTGTLKEYIGVFENEQGDQRLVTISDNQLYFQRKGDSKLKIKAFAKDQFFFDNVLNTINYSRNAGGEIEKLIFKNRQGSQEWTKTNKSIPVDEIKK